MSNFDSIVLLLDLCYDCTYNSEVNLWPRFLLNSLPFQVYVVTDSYVGYGDLKSVLNFIFFALLMRVNIDQLPLSLTETLNWY
jgi:hypothetical protein